MRTFIHKPQSLGCDLLLKCEEQVEVMEENSIQELESLSVKPPCWEETLNETREIQTLLHQQRLRVHNCTLSHEELVEEERFRLSPYKKERCESILGRYEDYEGGRRKRGVKEWEQFFRQAALTRQHSQRCRRFHLCCPSALYCELSEGKSGLIRALRLRRFSAYHACIKGGAEGKARDWAAIHTLLHLLN